MRVHPTNERKDESADNVYLLWENDEDEKETAEDLGKQWLVVSWEVLETRAGPHWFSISTYAIDKDTVTKLAALK